MLNDISKAIKTELDRAEKRADMKLTVFDVKDTEKIHQLYKSYEGCAEFLYIPSQTEIGDGIASDRVCYFGAKTDDGQLLSVSKIANLSIPSPFFIPPKYEDKSNRNFFGLSGMLVNKAYRRQGLAKTTTTEALNALSRIGAKGTYADCDYRNVASFSTLSSVFNFVGFTDGRKGAVGEQTIYTTFYLSFGDHPKKEIPETVLNLSHCEDINAVPAVLQTQMDLMGPHSSYTVDYCSGHNEIHVLDERVQTPNITLILEKEKPISLKKHIVIAKYNGRERE